MNVIFKGSLAVLWTWGQAIKLEEHRA